MRARHSHELSCLSRSELSLFSQSDDRPRSRLAVQVNNVMSEFSQLNLLCVVMVKDIAENMCKIVLNDYMA